MYRDPDPTESIVIVAFDGRLVALDRASGTPRWQFEFDVGSEGTRVAVRGERVYATSVDQVACLRASDGAEQWRTTVPMRHIGTLLVAPPQLLVAGSGEVAALDLDGRLLWHEPFRGKGLHPMALAVDGHEAQADAG